MPEDSVFIFIFLFLKGYICKLHSACSWGVQFYFILYFILFFLGSQSEHPKAS